MNSKNRLMMVISLGISLTMIVSGQTSGKIKYREVTRLDIQIEGDASQFSQSLPKEINATKELLFNEESSLYSNVEDEEAPMDEMMNEEGQTIRITMDNPDDMFYTDLVKKEVVEQKEFMTRQFLIKGAVSALKWQVTGNQKEILERPCQEAVAEENGKEVKAWFTPSIPVSAGPGPYCGLPGMILEVDIDNGQQTITAESVELVPVLSNDLEKPHKGKKVTREEYETIVAEKMKEQGGEAGGGHMMTIEIRQ